MTEIIPLADALVPCQYYSHAKYLPVADIIPLSHLFPMYLSLADISVMLSTHLWPTILLLPMFS